LLEPRSIEIDRAARHAPAGTVTASGFLRDGLFGIGRIGQGKENVRVFLKENPEVSAEIEARIRASLLPAKAAREEEGEEAVAEQA